MPGVEPFLLASSDDSYPAQFKSGARTTGFDGRRDEFVFLSQDYDFLWHKLGSPAHLEAFAEFLAQMRPDVVHFHHFLTLGIDLVTLTRKLLPKSRIIFTFHAFMSICYADGHMVRTMDGSLCTNASPVRCHQCFPECTPDHFLLRKMWFQKHLGPVDVSTVASRFMIERYADWGLPRERIVQVTNGQSDPAGAARTKTPFRLF